MAERAPLKSVPNDGPQPSARFRRMLDGVAEFKAREGRLPGCGRAPREERNLGTWLYRQRRRWSSGEMRAVEAESLEAALGPWWTLPPRKARRAESEALRHRPRSIQAPAPRSA